MDKEILKKKIDVDEMKAVWFPNDWHKIILERAKEEGVPVYKYVMMLSNNYQILNNEKKNV
jgi:LDH2 family malate/lactate/ureidoglycolate dehydrogenase